MVLIFLDESHIHATRARGRCGVDVVLYQGHCAKVLGNSAALVQGSGEMSDSGSLPSMVEVLYGSTWIPCSVVEVKGEAWLKIRSLFEV